MLLSKNNKNISSKTDIILGIAGRISYCKLRQEMSTCVSAVFLLPEFKLPITRRSKFLSFSYEASLLYLHSFLDGRQGSSPVPCSSSTHASICCRTLFHSRCTLDPDRRGSLQNTHSVRHGHCMSCILQTMGI